MVGTWVLDSILFISYYCWIKLFSSFLQVVTKLNVTKPSHVVCILKSASRSEDGRP